MPRCKIAMRLIEGARARAATYARRAKGIKKKAGELATLCGVQVALVCTAGDAGVVPLQWESEEGILDRYRAVPPEIRAQHTLRIHLEAELCKERAKLARVQQQGPGSLADVGVALGDMTPAEAGELLEMINATLRGTRKRLEALGLPADGLLEQTAADAVMAPQLGHDGFPCIGGNAGDMDAGFQLQMVPCPGKNDNLGRRPEEFLWDNNSYQMHNAETTQPPFGFQHTGGNYLGGVDSYGQMQAPGYGNAHYVCPELTMCHDQPCNGVLPVGYYYQSPPLGMGMGGHFINATPAPEQSAIVSDTGGEYAMGMGGNFTSVESYPGYWWSGQDFQRGDADTSNSSQAAPSPQFPAPGTRSSSKVFRHP
jgi:hypothetical protein